MPSSTSTTPSQALLDERPPGEGLVLAAAMGATVAGTMHLLAVPGHWAVSASMSAFFLGVGLAQLTLAASLGRRLPDVVLLGVVAAHLAIMGLYVASRTVDLPFVPPHDRAHGVEHLPVPGAIGDGVPVYPGSRVEPVGWLDLVCLFGELVLVLCVTALLPQRLRSTVTSAMVVLVVAGVAWRVWVLS